MLVFFIHGVGTKNRCYADALITNINKGLAKTLGREEGLEEQKAQMLRVTVPLLLKMEMNVEQIAQELNVDVEAVRKAALQQS